jgi:hypothetical protein
VRQRLAQQRRLAAANAPADGVDPLPLPASEMLVAEYDYAAQCAFQAHEDRARVSSYYLVSAGTAVAAILGVQREDVMPSLTMGFAAIFAILFIIGVLTLLQMIRLRQAWYDSAGAMNQIKNFYQQRFPDAELARAFAWTSSTLPVRGKFWSVAFLLAFSVILIDACAAGGSIIFYGYGVYGDDVVFRNVAIGVGVALLIAQIIIYRLLLRKKS